MTLPWLFAAGQDDTCLAICVSVHGGTWRGSYSRVDWHWRQELEPGEGKGGRREGGSTQRKPLCVLGLGVHPHGGTYLCTLFTAGGIDGVV